jgi:hypothetical protein
MTFAVRRIVGSRWFFFATVAAFAASALFVALTARPLLYDEWWHVDLIRIYSTRLTPFIAQQGPETAIVGEVQRNGSYLYHFVLSFPYRWLTAAGLSENAVIIWLRVITIAMPTVALFFFRRILRDIGLSDAVANVALLVYCALPVTSFVAGTVNYDNGVQLVGSVVIWLAVRIWIDPRRTVGHYALFLGLGALGCVTKFEFSPVFAALVAVVAFRYLTTSVRERSWRLPVPFETRGQRTALVVSLAVLVLGVALVLERYGVNVLVYRTLVPPCEQLHSDEFCSQYLVWARNAEYAQSHPVTTPFSGTLLATYIHIWFDGTIGTLPTVGTDMGFGTGAPITMLLIQDGVVIAAVAFFFAIGRVLKNSAFRAVIVVLVIYGVALFHTNLGFYRQYGVPATIQSRYWLLLLPLILGILGYAVNTVLTSVYRGRAASAAQTIVVVVLLLAITQGGFFLTFFVTANDSWFLADGPVRDTLLPLLRSIAGHLVITRPIP